MFCPAVSIGSRLKAWNTKPTCSRRNSGERGVVEPGEVAAGDRDGAGGGGVQAGQAVHQRRLARAGRPHDRGEAAGRQVDVDAAQGVHGGCRRGRRCGSGRGRWRRCGVRSWSAGRRHGSIDGSSGDSAAPDRRPAGRRSGSVTGVGRPTRRRTTVGGRTRSGARRPARSRRRARPAAPGRGTRSWPAAARRGSSPSPRRRPARRRSRCWCGPGRSGQHLALALGEHGQPRVGRRVDRRVGQRRRSARAAAGSCSARPRRRRRAPRGSRRAGPAGRRP